MKLDETMRARLRGLASEEHGGLTPNARARVLERLNDESSRRLGTRSWWTLPALLSASAALFYAWLAEPERTKLSTRSENGGDQAQLDEATPDEGQSAASAPQASGTSLTERAPCKVLEGQFRARPSGDAALELGTRALLVRSPTTELEASRLDTCSIAGTLRSGQVLVHARDLQGGELVVHTELVDVKVRGTVFSVASLPDESKVVVAVDEGVVEVRHLDSGALVLVRAGEQLTVRERASDTRSAWPNREREQLRKRLGLEATSRRNTTTEIDRERGTEDVASAPASDVAPEDKVWRAGSVPAPNVAPEPGSPVTEDGRPMKKPTIERNVRP